MVITITTQAKKVDAREVIFNFLESVDQRLDSENSSINSIDLMIADVAKDIIYGTVSLSKKELSEKLTYLEGYTGSPDLMCPPQALNAIKALRFLTGKK